VSARFVGVLAVTLLFGLGCTLTLDPSRHMGSAGDAGLATDVPDVPGLDAPLSDVPSIDVGMPDAGPPECVTAGDCDFASRCSMGRCVLCVDEAAVVQIDSDPMLGVADFDLLAAATSSSPELVMSWRGEGTRVYLHRTPLAAPLAPASRSSVTDALTLGVTGTVEVIDVALGADDYADGERQIDVAMVGRTASGTFLSAALYVGGTLAITSNTYPDADRIPGEQHFGRIAIDGRAVVSRRSAGASGLIDSLDLGYLNPVGGRSATFGVPTATITSMDASSAFVMMAEPSGANIYTWTAGSTGVDMIDSSGRTGEPHWTPVADRNFMLAYPAGREIFLRELRCVGLCVPSATVRADFATGSDEVAWVRIARLGIDFVLLTAERTGTTWRVVLRVLRPDFRPLTVPSGGNAWILAESSTSSYPVGRLVIGDADGVAYLAPAWIEQPTTGDRVLRVASEPVMCP